MDLDNFVNKTKKDHKGKMKSVDNLFSRKPNSRDWVDSAVVGGVVLTDAINGTVTDADIDPGVIDAFHSQYPNEGSFVEKIQELGDDPDAIQGLVSGVKGKLFEHQYVESLNEGGMLPDGQFAEIAESPVQPGWDVVIKDENGEIIEQLQLKITDSLAYVRESLERYPEFDIVLPSDVFSDLSSNSDIAGHLIDSGIDSENVMGPIGAGISDAAMDAGPDIFPELAFAFIAASAAYSVYKGKDKNIVWRDTKKRAIKAAVAGGIGGLAAFAVDPFVGLPAAMITRLLMSRNEVSKDFKLANDERIKNISNIENYVYHSYKTPKKPRLLEPSQLKLLTK